MKILGIPLVLIVVFFLAAYAGNKWPAVNVLGKVLP